MDILDMPMSMLFSNELTSSISIPNTAITCGPIYTETTSVLELERSQDELLLIQHQHQQMHMHMQLQQLQQLQRHQQLQQNQQLQIEMAQIGLDTPPMSPMDLSSTSTTTTVTNNCMTSAHQDQAESSLLSSLLDSSLSPDMHQRQLSYSPLQMQQRTQPQPQQDSSPQAQTAISSPYSFASDSPFISTVGNPNIGEKEIDLFPMNHTASSFPTSDVHSMLYSVSSSPDQYAFTTGAGMSTSINIGSSEVNSPILTPGMIKREIPSPTTPTIAAIEHSPPSSCNCNCNKSDLDALSLSTYSIIGENEHSPLEHFDSTHTNSHHHHHHQAQQQPIRAKPRPKSMIVSSASYPLFSSSAMLSQPYASSYHDNSVSSPTSPVVMIDPYIPPQDRRRSSSGTFASFGSPAPVSPLSTQPSLAPGAGHHFIQSQQQQEQQQQQQQSQRAPLQYHPSHHHFQHLLDPEDLPKIPPGSHHCPVCNRFFSRPFNLRSHVLTHSSFRPFSCLYCPWRFSRHFDLLRHCRAKHKGLVEPKAPNVKVEKE